MEVFIILLGIIVFWCYSAGLGFIILFVYVLVYHALITGIILFCLVLVYFTFIVR